MLQRLVEALGHPQGSYYAAYYSRWNCQARIGQDALDHLQQSMIEPAPHNVDVRFNRRRDWTARQPQVGR
jgi:hypothetical protein